MHCALHDNQLRVTKINNCNYENNQHLADVLQYNIVSRRRRTARLCYHAPPPLGYSTDHYFNCTSFKVVI